VQHFIEQLTGLKIKLPRVSGIVLRERYRATDAVPVSKTGCVGAGRGVLSGRRVLGVRAPCSRRAVQHHTTATAFVRRALLVRPAGHTGPRRAGPGWSSACWCPRRLAAPARGRPTAGGACPTSAAATRTSRCLARHTRTTSLRWAAWTMCVLARRPHVSVHAPTCQHPPARAVRCARTHTHTHTRTHTHTHTHTRARATHALRCPGPGCACTRRLRAPCWPSTARASATAAAAAARQVPAAAATAVAVAAGWLCRRQHRWSCWQRQPAGASAGARPRCAAWMGSQCLVAHQGGARRCCCALLAHTHAVPLVRVSCAFVQAGGRCSNAVDTTVSPFCQYHALQQARTLRAPSKAAQRQQQQQQAAAAAAASAPAEPASSNGRVFDSRTKTWSVVPVSSSSSKGFGASSSSYRPGATTAAATGAAGAAAAAGGSSAAGGLGSSSGGGGAASVRRASAAEGAGAAAGGSRGVDTHSSRGGGAAQADLRVSCASLCKA
jgi:hypothetical protein